MKGGPSKEALSKMGDEILQSDGVFDPEKKILFGQFWKSTNQ